jgi:hypothetical protein
VKILKECESDVKHQELQRYGKELGRVYQQVFNTAKNIDRLEIMINQLLKANPYLTFKASHLSLTNCPVVLSNVEAPQIPWQPAPSIPVV